MNWKMVRRQIRRQTLLVNIYLENENKEAKRKGGVAPSVFKGQIYENKRGCKAEVICYKNSKNVSIRFLDDVGYIKSVGAKDLREGNFKNPFHPSVYGFGSTGVVTEDIKNHPLYKKACSCWRSAIERSYSKKWHKKFPTYQDCTVCEEWLLFTNFFHWFISEKGSDIKDFQLDKDLLFRGNRVYSPETCCLVPCILNNVILDNESSKGKYKKGVTFDKRTCVFQAKISVRNKNKTLGVYKDEDSAHKVYLAYKKQVILDLAEEWKSLIREDVYKALINWELK